MADEQTQAVTTEAPQAGAVAASNVPAPDAEDVNALPAWAQKAIADLRKESASHRKAKTEAERAAAAQAEQAAKDQGKWKELYEQAEPQAKRAASLEKFIADMVAAELDAVPDRIKTIVPAFDDPLKTLDWLRTAKAAGILAKPSAPATDAASGMGDKTGTDAAAKRQSDIDVWQRMGLTNAVRAAQGK